MNGSGQKQGLVASFPMGEIYSNENIEKVYPIYFNSPKIPFSIVGMSDIMPYESTKYSEMTDDMLNILVNEFKAVLVTEIPGLRSFLGEDIRTQIDSMSWENIYKKIEEII